MQFPGFGADDDGSTKPCMAVFYDGKKANRFDDTHGCSSVCLRLWLLLIDAFAHLHDALVLGLFSPIPFRTNEFPPWSFVPFNPHLHDI